MIRIAVRTPHALSSITKGDIGHLGSEIGSRPSCAEREVRKGNNNRIIAPFGKARPVQNATKIARRHLIAGRVVFSWLTERRAEPFAAFAIIREARSAVDQRRY